VQFARLLGARRVLATVSNAQKAQIARDAGADVTIDYRAPDAAEQARAATNGQGVDRVIELDIAANAALDLDVLRPGGDLVVYGSGAPRFDLSFFPLIVKNLKLRFFIVYNLEPADRALAIETLTGLLERGALQHLVAERLPLAQIAQAHELVEQGRAVGNVVLALP
jgi:NADPH2:quinone reductase